MLTSSLRHRLNDARTVASNHLYTITTILKSKNTKYYCKQSKKQQPITRLPICLLSRFHNQFDVCSFLPLDLNIGKGRYADQINAAGRDEAPRNRN